MGGATYAIPNFLGGEISQFAQGRFDRPDYRVSLNVCLNSFPNEVGTWIRRPGTAFAGTSRSGAPARIIKFDFAQASAVTLEFTDGKLRFRSGAVLITGNDPQVVVAISAANPAVVQMTTAVTWATGDIAMLPGASTPLLENRQFILTKIDTTHFSLSDPLTGAAIDGSSLGALVAGATIARVQEVSTVYVSGSWSNLRAVQAETTDVLLAPKYPPQALTVTTLPTTGVKPVFAITPAIFNDGPYLDPPTNGAQITPSALSGLITLTLTFAAYSATTAYPKGALVIAASINYVSLSDQNVGNTPVSSPLFWAATSAAAAINNGLGFLGTDVGRLVRLFSEPQLWNSATGYLAGNTVTYNPSGQPGASTYWQAQTTVTGSNPGADLTNWKIIPQGAAIWSWGKITALSNVIDRLLAGSVNIGDMFLFGGVNAPFDGVFSQNSSQSAVKQIVGGFAPSGVPVTIAGFVGKKYSASPQKIQQVTVYPPSDTGFGQNAFTIGGVNNVLFPFFTLNLRAKQSAPVSSSDGALLGTLSFSGSSQTTTLISNDQTTLWNYVWVELIQTTTPGGVGASSYVVDILIGQISFFSPTTSAAASTACTLEILGSPLLYAQPVRTWRLGVYSDTTGWPTCGCYDDGRLWLGGAISNRFDASRSNGIVPGSSLVDFAPTDPYGVVAPDNGISETINADSSNPLFWMKPDLQGILIGTQAGEFLILAPTSGSIADRKSVV